MTDIQAILRELFEVFVHETSHNESLRARVTAIIEEHAGQLPQNTEVGSPVAAERNSTRRAKARIDPIEIAARDKAELERTLVQFSLDELKDIVAEFGLDPSKKAMKWRTPERLINFILETSIQRARKGDAFRVPR